MNSPCIKITLEACFKMTFEACFERLDDFVELIAR